MINEVELLEELPYYRTLQKPPHHQSQQHHGPPLSSAPHYPTAPRGLRMDPSYDETAIAIIAPDIRVPQNNNPLSISSLEHCEQYSPLGCLDILMSIMCYAGDLGSDLVVCYVLFAEKRILWAVLTATFVLLSSVVVNVLSIHWYIRNQRSSASVYTSVSKLTWVIRSLFHIFFMGLIYRYLYLLFKCLCKDHLEDRDHRSVMEARKRKNAILQMTIKEDKQTATLCLLHSFLESAPQLILQLYTLAQRTDRDSQVIVFIQGACAASSLFQLAWSITSYNSTLHRTMLGKKKANSVGKALQFLWHFCTIGSRACTLALFTKEYHFWLFPFCIGHWGVMTIWVMHQQTRFCRKNGDLHQCKEYMCNMVVGVAYVIYYLNVKAEPTRYKYSAYYAIVFAENCALMTLWFLRNDPGVWYHIPALVAVFSSFASGIVFMLFYYGFCHRTLKQTNEKRAAHCC
ncbi:XK-related protein 6-like [Argiope bruennichi]|uniref:XK-related protein n=1 Tax=Argiope bruennichi TaxID=94029 RepID=A0A8T0FB70_ARGBR|nr:XK-related protein 6-like [Argiope bruennichi]KAF8786193.1 XK-related protein 4 like protein [Argiope bruennichi]